MAVLPGVLGCRSLRRTVQVRLGTNTLRLPGGTPIFVVSRQQFMKYPGYLSRECLPFIEQIRFRFLEDHAFVFNVFLSLLN
ncbi:MAG: hypothetical protein V3T37_08915 [Syntrophobacteria bacterium]